MSSLLFSQLLVVFSRRPGGQEKLQECDMSLLGWAGSGVACSLVSCLAGGGWTDTTLAVALARQPNTIKS